MRSFNHLFSKLILLAAAPLFAQIPSVQIDGPAPGAVLSGTVTVSGWALDNIDTNLGSAISSVVIQIDGTTVGNASMGITRTDVCGQYPARPGCPNVGWAYSLDTTTLTPGSHTLTALATNTDSVPETGTASVQVSVGPSPVVVMIDSPTAGAVVSGTINVSGWALDNAPGGGTPIKSVQVLVDGVSAGNATYGGTRTDVCGLYPGRPNCPNVGFTLPLDTTAYGPGAHTVTVTATDSDGTPDSGSASATMTVTVPPTVMIDSLTAGAVVSGVVNVSGWAFDNGGASISSVQVLVDGNVVGMAVYGVSRVDVCTSYPGRVGCPNVGFTYMLDTSTLSSGTHTLTAAATDNDGTPDTGSWTINITRGGSPTVTIENPLPGDNVSRTVTVSGWALDSAASVGTAITSVQVLVDGTPVGSAVYGINRTDVCAVYPGRPGCPNVGFSYNLDTTRLSNGPHTIMVLATDADSTVDNNSASVTVNVTSNSGFHLDSPASGDVLTGLAFVTGWAIAPPGAQMGGLRVYVDSVQVGFATYPLFRQDVCAVYPDGNGCPFVGFFYGLDTNPLTVGTHMITVTASLTDGGPPIGSQSAIVTVRH